MERHRPWFDEHPEWLEHELDRLRGSGATVEVDEVARNAGRLRLLVDYPVPEGSPAGVEGAPAGGSVRLEAEYPDTYPDFGPHVTAPDVRLPRHVHPRDGTLCLLPKSTRFWSRRWCLDDLLREQLPKLLRQGVVTDPAAVAANPDETAEPYSTYLDQERPLSVFVDDEALASLGACASGQLQVGLRPGAPLPTPMTASFLDEEGEAVGSLPAALTEQFSVPFSGSWCRLDAPPRATTAKELFEEVRPLIDRAGRIKPGKKAKMKGGELLDVVGLVFPEEHVAGREGIGVTFLMKLQPHPPKGRPQRRSTKGRARVVAPKPVWLLAPAAPVSRAAYAERVPLLRPLQEATVVVVGLGSIGAPIAIELARNVVGRLRLADFDYVEAPQTVRWPLGLEGVGFNKASVIRNFIRHHYPLTEVDEALTEQIGGTRRASGPDGAPLPLEQEDLGRLLDGADLVVDATAEVAVASLLSRLCRERGIPFLSAFATHGAWGGAVMREVAGRTEGCWYCFQADLDHRIAPPPADLSRGPQPRGCQEPTFTGASFDLSQVSMQAARLAVATLCSGYPGSYPDLPHDVLVLANTESDGTPCLPSWTGYALERSPRCPVCSSPAGASL